MNLEKLNKQLRRDLAANPKKSAALGLMVLVAIYFWGPLVWKLLPADGPKRDTKADMSALILTDDPVDSAQLGQSRRGPKFRWEKVRQLIAQDSRMASAPFEVAWIDPFAKPSTSSNTLTIAETPAEDPAATAAAAAAAAAVDPTNLGIVLGGIMTGPRGSIATINGEAHREGDQVILADKQDQTASYQFRVVKITRGGVQLEAAGRLFTLKLAQPKLAQGDDIERTKTATIGRGP